MLNSRVVWVTLAGCLTQSFLTGHSKGHPILSLLDRTRYILSFSSIDVQMRDALVLTSYSPECSWQLSRRKVWEPQNQFWTFWPKTHSTANPQRSNLWHPILLEEETGSNHNESIKSGWLTRLQSQHWCEPATQAVSVRLFSTFVVFILQTEKEMLQMKNIIFLTSVPRDLFCLCWEVRQHIPLKRGCGALRIEAEQVPESSQRCSPLRKSLPLMYLSTRGSWKTYIWPGGTSVQGAEGPGMVRVRDGEGTDNGQGFQVTFPGSAAALLFSERLGECMLQWPLGWCAESLISLCLRLSLTCLLPTEDLPRAWTNRAAHPGQNPVTFVAETNLDSSAFFCFLFHGTILNQYNTSYLSQKNPIKHFFPLLFVQKEWHHGSVCRAI